MTGGLVSIVKKVMASPAKWAMASQIVTSAANFSSSILLLRGLGIDGFGRYSFVFIAIMIVRNFLDTMVLIPVSTIGPKQKPFAMPNYRALALSMAVGFTTLATLLLVLIFAGLGYVDGYDWTEGLFLPLILANVFANMSDFFRRTNLVFGRAYLAFLIDFTRFSIQISLLLILILADQDWLTEVTALYVLSAGSIAGAVLGFLSYERMRFCWGWIGHTWLQHWRFSKWMLPATAFKSLQNSGAMLIAGFMLGDAALGLMRGIQQITNVLTLIFNTANQILPSMASKRYVAGGHAAMVQFLRVSAIGGIAILAVGTLCLYAVSDLIFVQWMQLNSPDLYLIFFLFCFHNMVSYLNLNNIVFLSVRERGDVITKATFSGAIASVIAVLTLIQSTGSLSVAISQILGGCVSMMVALHSIRSLYPKS